MIETNRDRAKVYELPVLDPSTIVTAELVVSYTGAKEVRGADISPDGRRLALVIAANKYALIIERNSSSTDVKDFFISPTRQWWVLFDIYWLEGITFIPGKYDFIMEQESGEMRKITEDQYNPPPKSSPPPTVGYTLKWESYDAEHANKVSVLNDQLILTYPSTDVPENNDAWISMAMDVTKYVVSGTNTLIFRENVGSGQIRNVVVLDSNGKVICSDSTARSLWTPNNADITYAFSAK